jgi:two-component system KDP operon response regulator KdpE
VTTRILIVEDEPALRRSLAETLRQHEFAVEEAGSAEVALMLVASLRPDLILLDLGLPDLDGKEVVRRVRHEQAVPILIVSARDQEAEKVAALEAGADDYLTKPFGSAELVARIRVALRHRARELAPTSTQEFGELTWRPEEQRVLRGGVPLHLTPTEYRLFQTLAASPGRVLTYGTLLREVWGASSLEQAPSVRVAVATLRRKLGDGERGVRYIATEVGTGYRFLAPGASASESITP